MSAVNSKNQFEGHGRELYLCNKTNSENMIKKGITSGTKDKRTFSNSRWNSTRLGCKTLENLQLRSTS